MLITSQDTNELGMCTGGAVLSWIDVAGGMSASRLANAEYVPIEARIHAGLASDWETRRRARETDIVKSV